jgi:uncharacterized protein
MFVTAAGLAGCEQHSGSTRSVFDVGLMRVQDRANIIPAAEEIDLVRESEALEKATSDQVVVATVPTLGGQDIARFSRDLANREGIGQAGKDNGVLIVIAPNDRKVRIAVGYGLEALLSDQRAAGIVQDMLPYFRSGNAPEAAAVGLKEVDTVLRSDLRRPQYLKKAA